MSVSSEADSLEGDQSSKGEDENTKDAIDEDFERSHTTSPSASVTSVLPEKKKRKKKKKLTAEKLAQIHLEEVTKVAFKLISVLN